MTPFPYHDYHTFLWPGKAIQEVKKGIEEVPEDLLIEWSFKLLALMNLAWDYVDTICDICVSMRMESTKKLVRQIRLLKSEYDKFRCRVMSKHMEDEETGHALRFEECFKDDFTRLFYGLEAEVNKQKMSPELKSLVIAVQEALTLMDAVKIYARWCDTQIKGFGVWVCDCCMVQSEFLRLYALVPKFAGENYKSGDNTRKLTARILANRLRDTHIEHLLTPEEIKNYKAHGTD